jgi:diacylglycerol kinase family enzyme
MPGIGYITNPRSRANLRDPVRARQLAYLLGNRGWSEATRSLDDLYRVVEEFRRERIDVVAVNGGDGTLHHTLTAFIRTYGSDPLPAVAFLRGGTMNTIANSFGVRGSTEALLYDLIDRYHSGEELRFVERELLQVGDSYGFIFGNGMISNFLRAYYGTGRPSPAMAARLLARGVVSSLVGGAFARQLFRRFRGRVVVDGEEWAREDFVTVTAAAVTQIGLGFKPFYRCGEQPGKFPVLGIHTTPLGMVMELPRLFLGRPMRRDKVINLVASAVLFESDDALEYTIDGDTYSARRSLELRTGPKIRVVVP